MNVKQFTSIAKSSGDKNPLRFILCAGADKEYEIISQYDPNDQYHITAFGNWKIKNIVAPSENNFEIIIDTITQIITE